MRRNTLRTVFAWGAAQELKETGSQWAVIATLGDWKSLAFLGYADLTDSVEQDMAKLLIECEPLSDEEEVHWVCENPSLF